MANITMLSEVGKNNGANGAYMDEFSKQKIPGKGKFFSESRLGQKTNIRRQET